MAGLSGTGSGLSADPSLPSDLDTIYQGGQFFLDRMKAMDAQRATLAQALADLDVGRDIVATQKDAHNALIDAQNKQMAADHALADAKEQAAKIVSDAQIQARDAVAASTAAASQIDAEAIAAKKAADDYAAHTTARADSVLAAANQQLTDISARTTAAENAISEAATAKAAAEAAIKVAEAAKAAHDERLAQIAAIMAQPVATT